MPAAIGRPSAVREPPRAPKVFPQRNTSSKLLSPDKDFAI
jgi:hypothetical protein